MPAVYDEMPKDLAMSRLRTEVVRAVTADEDPEVVERLQDFLCARHPRAQDHRQPEPRQLAQQRQFEQSGLLPQR